MQQMWIILEKAFLKRCFFLSEYYFSTLIFSTLSLLFVIDIQGLELDTGLVQAFDLFLKPMV